MKNLFGLLFFFGAIPLTNAQTVADWTKTDCAGTDHTLYTQLDSEQVVIMEFAMGCSSCTDAAFRLLNSKDKFSVSNPGKVKVYYMDYWTGNECGVEVAAATAPYAFDATFDHCMPEKDYYFTSTSSPMPGIIVAAGSFHSIIYQNNNFSDDDTLAIEQAITTFFANVGMTENKFESNFDVFPNPSHGESLVSFLNSKSGSVTLTLFSLTGQPVAELYKGNAGVGRSKIKADLTRFPKGAYFLHISSNEENAYKKIILN